MTVENVEVTEDMADYVRVYTEYCSAIRAKATEFWIEKRFNLASLNPPGPMFGTSDFAAYVAEEKTLYVVDLKFGVGVIVEPTTPQAKYYALGAALTLDPNIHVVNDIVLVIVQPRATHPDGPIRTLTIPYMELIEFAGELMDRARETTKPDAPLHAGSHCKFCPAAGICPEQRDAAQRMAMVDFADMPVDVPPSPETLPLDVFVDILQKKHILESWLKSLDARALAMLERGEDVPGFKLVERRATRKWKDEEETLNYISGTDMVRDDYLETKLKSPAQLEKLFKGKKKFETAMGNLVVKQSSGYTMTTSLDPRPAVALTPGQDFDALPASTQDTQATRNENETV